MLEKNRANRYRSIFYITLIICIPIAAYKDYLHWLNPLNLKAETNPKQHDGSQAFQPPEEWESSIQPAPDEDGVRRYLDPYELHKHGKETEPSTDEIVVTPEDDQKELPILPQIGIDN